MSPIVPIVYRISVLLGVLLAEVPVGTNLALFWLLWALLSGRFLRSRGAVFPALADLGLPADAVRRSSAALTYGRWTVQALLKAWQNRVQQEGRWHAHAYEGFRPVVGDVVGFFRPQLRGCVGKHSQSGAKTALPAIVLAVVAAVGSVGNVRVPLLRLLVRADPSHGSEAELQRRAITQAGATLQPDAVLVVEAGFGVADLLTSAVPRFVARVARHFTARRNRLPPYKGRGRCPIYGARVRPLPRTRQGKSLAATPPDAITQWVVAGRRIRAQVWDNLVLATAKPGAAAFRCVVIHDPRYREPWVIATNLPVSAYALWRLYRDRWPIEQAPLAAKQMLGAHRAFVCGSESRYRLPELALLAGNILAYVAATAAAVATGFWDRHCRPTGGRLRRVLLPVHFSEVPVPAGALRKKASVTVHLPKGVQGHRRRKGSPTPLTNRLRQQKAA
jgi:hypothetical protein